MSRTFAFLKPANPVIHEMITKRILNDGFRIVRREEMRLNAEILAEHYAHVMWYPFYTPMAAYLVSGPIMAMILERDDGKDPVQVLRDLRGPTDPKEGKPGQISHDFGIHDRDTRYINGLHASGSAEEAEEEIARFFKQ